MIKTTEHTVHTRGHCDIHDLTPALRNALTAAGLKEGQAVIFVAGSTAGVTTVEFEPGLVRDIHEFFERLIPRCGADWIVGLDLAKNLPKHSPSSYCTVT